MRSAGCDGVGGAVGMRGGVASAVEVGRGNDGLGIVSAVDGVGAHAIASTSRMLTLPAAARPLCFPTTLLRRVPEGPAVCAKVDRAGNSVLPIDPSPRIRRYAA